MFLSAGKHKLVELRECSDKDNLEDNPNPGTEENSQDEDGQLPSVQTFDGSLISLALLVPSARLSARTFINCLLGK